ncbi:MAG: DUF6876 family protein [Rhodococcus sp. (in: high G+C Gram-positive bacteria)]
MGQFSGGSDGRTRHVFNRRFIYTAGVKAVAELAGAYWLLDIVATEIAPIALQRWTDLGDNMLFVTIFVKDSKAVIQADNGTRGQDGDGREVYFQRDIEFTDFPEGDWPFYMCMDGIIDNPNEVTVMLLPHEY